jgi:ATP-binding cassette subfamily B protein
MKQKQAGLKLTVQMVQMTWAASSRAFLSLFFLSSLQGISALALAWISKLLFDLIGKALSGTAINITQELLPILFAQAVLMIIIQTIGPSNQFVRAEFSRRLSIKVQTEAYRKINQLPDIAYFEDPQFYDTFRLATQGAQNGPSMIVDNISNLTRYAITLLSFSSLLLAFNPLLAIPVGLVTLPQLYAELKMGRQRFRLVSELSPSERKSFYYSYLLSTIYPAKEIRLFNLGDYFLGKGGVSF